ncbi:hypothetical protein ACJX0J_030148, partial [Zea mays]
ASSRRPRDQPLVQPAQALALGGQRANHGLLTAAAAAARRGQLPAGQPLHEGLELVRV